MAANQSDTTKTTGADPDKDAKANENVLEKALEDTFPASDPPSSGSPTQAVGWEEPPKDDKKD
jgi:hypothetical protein